MSQLSTDRLKELSRIILKGTSADARKEALLEIRRSDHPKVIDLLQEVSRTDRDKAVRDLATNLLTKKKIEAAASPSTPSVEPVAGGWTCAACGGSNARTAGACAFCGEARSGGATAPSAGKSPLDAEGLFIVNPINLRDLKRPPGFFTWRTGCLPLFLFIFVLVGVGTIAVMLNTLRERSLLEQRPAETTGTVTGKRIDTDSDSGDTYYVSYEFEAEGRRFSDQVSVSWERYNQYESGQRVPVIYAQGEPDISSITGSYNGLDLGFLAIFTVCWNGFTWPLFIGSIVAVRQQGRLFREGKLVAGEVLAAKGDRDSDNDFVLELEYGFAQPGSTNFITGTYRSSQTAHTEATLPGRGAPLAILCRTPTHHQPL
jgi:hypothetical protein